MSNSSPLAIPSEIQAFVQKAQSHLDSGLDPLQHAGLIRKIKEQITAATQPGITRTKFYNIWTEHEAIWQRFQATGSEASALDPPADSRRALDQGGMTKEEYQRKNLKDLVEQDVTRSQREFQSPRLRQQPQARGEEGLQHPSLPPPPRRTRNTQPQQSPASQGYPGTNPSQAPYHLSGNVQGMYNPSQPPQANLQYTQQMPPPTAFPPSGGGQQSQHYGGQYTQGATGQVQRFPATQGYPAYNAQSPNMAPHQGGAGHQPSYYGQAMPTGYPRGAAPGQHTIAGHPTQQYQNLPPQGAGPHSSYGQGVYAQGAPPGQGAMFQNMPQGPMIPSGGHNRNVSTNTFGHGTSSGPTHARHDSVSSTASNVQSDGSQDYEDDLYWDPKDEGSK